MQKLLKPVYNFELEIPNTAYECKCETLWSLFFLKLKKCMVTTKHLLLSLADFYEQVRLTTWKNSFHHFRIDTDFTHEYIEILLYDTWIFKITTFVIL